MSETAGAAATATPAAQGSAGADFSDLPGSWEEMGESSSESGSEEADEPAPKPKAAPVKAKAEPAKEPSKPAAKRPAPEKVQTRAEPEVDQDDAESEEDAEPQKAAPKEPARPKIPPKLKVTVNGKAQEIESAKVARALGLSPEELEAVGEKTAIRLYQREVASNERFRASSEIEKQWEGLAKRWAEDPEGTFSALAEKLGGAKAEEIASKMLERKFELDTMDPEARERYELQRQVEEFKAKEARQAQEAQEREQAEFRERTNRQYQTQIVEALKAAPDLPQSAQSVRRVAAYMRQMALQGMDVDAEVAVKLVRDDYRSEHSSFMKGLDAEKLIELIGEEGVEKIRKYRLEKYRKSPAVGANPEPRRTSQVASASRSAARELRKMNFDHLGNKW